MILFILISTLFCVFYIFGYFLIPALTGVPLKKVADINENSSGSIIQAALILQGLSQLSMFLFPSLVFALFAHPKPIQYLGLRAPGKSLHWLLVLLLVITATPLLIGLESFIHSLNLGKWAEEAQKNRENIEKPFLKMSSVSDFAKILFVIAVLPALGEEFLFRGILLRMAKKRSAGILLPIIGTALLFALVHFEVYGFISLFLAGFLLGSIYYLTGSLWCSILYHFLTNGLQVAIAYFGQNNKTIQAIIDTNTIPLSVILICLVLFAAFFYLLLKTKTPLPVGWEKDYTPIEHENHTILQ